MSFHHGHLQVLPPTWAFLRLTCKQLIDTWYVGNNRDKITTLELLRAMRVAHLRTHVNMNAGRQKLKQLICVVATLEKYAKKEN